MPNPLEKEKLLSIIPRTLILVSSIELQVIFIQYSVSFWAKDVKVLKWNKCETSPFSYSYIYFSLNKKGLWFAFF